MSPDPWDDLAALTVPEPAPMTPEELEAAADEYQREQIATAQSEAQERECL